MRTTKRFTPAVLRRFVRQGRGLGTFDDYKAWHQVSRGDPASRGRSHLQLWMNRQLDLLSDIEWTCTLFSSMDPEVVDIRPQFPLALSTAQHELGAYRADYTGLQAPGTREIAARFGIAHPAVTGQGERSDWVLSTDLLLTLEKNGDKSLLAVSAKPEDGWRTPRQIELFSIEQAYWNARGVRWQLITPAQYAKSVGLTLRRTAAWALGPSVSEEDRRLAAIVATRLQGRSERLVLETLHHLLKDMDRAQRALWQAIWSGQLPVDLDRGHRNHLPLRHVPIEHFVDQNPVRAGRSAWN